MNTNFTVASYNVGAGITDYQQILSPEEKSSLGEDLEPTRKVIEQVAGETLAAAADVICMQEVGTIEREVMQSLLKRGFY